MAMPLFFTDSTRARCTISAVLGSSVPVGSSARKSNGSLASWRARTHRLLLAAGQVAGDVHGAVLQIDHLEQGQMPSPPSASRSFRSQRLEDVLDDAGFAEEGEGALQHDGDAFSHRHSQGVPLVQAPEIHLLDGGLAHRTSCKALPFLRHVDPTAFLAIVDTIDDPALVWLVLLAFHAGCG